MMSPDLYRGYPNLLKKVHLILFILALIEKTKDKNSNLSVHGKRSSIGYRRGLS